MGNRFFSSLKKWRKTQSNPKVIQDCFSCAWFQFPEKGLQNRQCKCPRITGPTVNNPICREWKLDPEWRKRVRGSMGVVR